MLNEINPYIRKASPSVISPYGQIRNRIILDYELIRIDSGHFTLTYGGVDYAIGQGDMLLLCPDVPHAFHLAEESVSQPHIHFDMAWDPLSRDVYICFSSREQLKERDKRLIRPNLFSHLQTTPILQLRDREAFCACFDRVIEARDKHSLQTKADMLGLIQMILEDNFSSLLRNERPVGSVAKSVKDFLDRNSEGELTLDHIAELFSYSKSYLDRCFVREYGIPIMKYRNMRRMARAKLLLGNHSVGEVAEMLGFSSIYAFSRAFRDHVGMSPTAYRHHTERASTD